MVRVGGVYDQRKQQELFLTLLEGVGKKAGYGELFYFGVATGLRISDILALKVADFRQKMQVQEAKTGKIKQIELSPELICMLENYISGRELAPTDRVFPVSRQAVLSHFKRAGKQIGLPDVGTHTMRITYAWNVFTLTGSIFATQSALQHKYVSTTVGYLLGGLKWLLGGKYRGKFKGIPPCI